MDHKAVAIATEDPEFNSYKDASEIPAHYLLMLRRFFQDYKKLENKAVEVDRISPAETAYPVIRAALKKYKAKHRKSRRS